MKRFSIFLGFIALQWVSALAQNVEFTATAPNVVAKGEQFRLTFSLNAEPKEFNPPGIQNFDVLAGPSLSTSTSVQVINGSVTRAVNYSYTFILEAAKEGKFTIGSATATVNKKEYTTSPITIEVVKGDEPARTNTNQNAAGARGTEVSKSDLFLVVQLNKSKVYRGEPVLATVRLYSRFQLVDLADPKLPTLNGFWNQTIELPDGIKVEGVNLNGKIYQSAVLKQYLLFPQKSGKLVIDPFEIVVVYQQRSNAQRSVFDDFFGMTETYRKRVASEPVTVNVKDLPDGAPASFSGAVGSFKIEAKTDKSSVKSNEAITYRVKISGKGNLQLIETPKVSFPAGFEVFDPKVADSYRSTLNGVSGSKTYEFVSIPRTSGDYSLEPFEFTYFDPSAQAYKTLTASAMPISVISDGNDTGLVQISGLGKEDIKFIGKDIRFIKSDFAVKRRGQLLFGSPLYWLFFPISIMVFILVAYYISRHRELISNVALIKNKRATKEAKRRLKEAQKHLIADNKDKFYEELLRALWGFISDKLMIPVSVLNKDNVHQHLIDLKVDEDILVELELALSECEMAQYSPIKGHSHMDELYNKVHAAISKLESAIGK
ncbi:MAG: protein BatD [Bacteroidales bacterium]|nr:protein BatD [Bacteroidales bacterium]MBN2749144.1 protein BatD [Bacteroidales bacterium]